MAIKLLSFFRRGQSADGKNEESQDEVINVPEGPYVAASLFYLSVVLLVGLPIWFQTCSTSSYSLPDLTHLEAKLNNPQHPIRLNLEVSLVQLPAFGALNPGDQDPEELTTNQLTHYLRAHLPQTLKTSLDNVEYEVSWRVRRPIPGEYKAFQENHAGSQARPQHLKLSAIRELEEQLKKLHKSSGRFKLFVFYIDEKHHQDFCDTSKYLLSSERFVYICNPPATTNEHYEAVMRITLDALGDIYHSTIDADSLQHLIQGKVDLLFSLISESPQHIHLLPGLASQLHALYDKNVLKEYPELKELVNISPITQQLVDVVDDELLSKILLPTPKVQNNDTQPRLIKTSQVSQLFHKFESRISKHSSQNVYNTLVVKPDPTKQPLLYDTSSMASGFSILYTQQSNSLLIVNDEKSVVLGLRALVRKLIGLSSVNLCENCLIRRDVFFNRHELDAIMGALTIFKLNKVFISLSAMNQQMIGLRISREVSGMAYEAQRLALEVIEHLRNKRPVEAYRDANKAFELSEQAYYNPTLIESSYFPDELKYAIYTPLFLPLAPPFISSLVGIFRYFLEQRRR